MFVLIGFDTKVSEETNTTVSVCPHCNNINMWIAFKETTWFSLFFIPIIPLKTEYYKSCPICRYSIKLSKEEFRSIRF
ncbi:zinc-ribbon domain-containing protein [Puteibacter caeruleilacunae]|nr:zinc-ribbon domain-containing protein [Puteibacter caeruleilacunae]